MTALLLAVDDGLTSANLNMADVMFLLGTIAAALAGLAYVAGFPIAEDATPGRWHRYSHWAAALVAFAVGFVAFGLFLL